VPLLKEWVQTCNGYLISLARYKTSITGIESDFIEPQRAEEHLK
jgi:hypothetical protein